MSATPYRPARCPDPDRALGVARRPLRLTPLAVAVQLSCAAALWIATPAPASAQSASQSVRYDIPAGPLATSLNRFAQQSGVSIVMDAGQLQGMQAPALNGSYGRDEGFEQLLRGTGLTAVPTSAGYVLRKVATTGDAGHGATLPEVVVQGAGMNGTTEGTGSYTDSGPVSTATKLGLTLRETPQAVTVITNERIQDQGLATVNDVVQTAPGLTFRRFGPERASFYSRGLYVDNIMYDGLPVGLDSSNLSQDLLATDMAIYDRVEIVRGATGLVQGAGNPSAAINLVRKRPTKVPQVSVGVKAGTWDRYRAEVDASGPLSEDGTLRGRAVIAAQDYGSYKRGENSNGQTFYGILEKDLAPSTTLTLSALHQENRLHGNGFTGLPVARDGSDLGLPRSTSYANDWEYWNKTTNSGFVGLDHRFDNGWRMHLSAYYAQADVDMEGHYLSYSYTTGNYSQLGARNAHREKQSSADVYANGPFELLGRKHELVLGASYRNVDFNGNSRQGLVLNSNLNLYNFNPSAVADPNIALRDWMDARIGQQSLYATTRLNLTDRLKLILGGRLDWFDYNDTVNTYPNFNANTPSVTAHNRYSVNNQLTKYAGVVFDLNAQHSLYASYTDIFKPQNYLDASNKLLDPVVGKNYEIGIKGEYFEGALNASAAVFRIDQNNRAFRSADQTQCASYPTVVCYSAAGEVRSQGVEFEVQGAITPNWQVGAGYTVAIARYRKDATASNVGAIFDTDTPRHLFKLSTMYRLRGPFQGWRIGGSIYAQDSIYNQGTASGVPFRISQGAYTLVDLVVGWQPIPKLDLQLNINNVFNKRYYNALSGSVGFPSNVYGEPRNAMLSARYQF
ncbi:TonB-dependent siderophore receptor [Cupriavidus agavae]|uniref:Outer membrane receptor for ferric coprogen and ferric-rhodotorulic acid n=1 Tax=Cupriavidus agavae TaxID=1001822 RepID=A0A4Q7RRF0_9BURK|nr:TonB-dependent siderophore receptor [Cupriavidus agavae]RZT35517.1 outer membrane receptor for ferric coprogen and ferric-rhodotorulic acid [Cupriavidus agavae]